jgi:LPXTG-motif cell wall-anchored protein
VRVLDTVAASFVVVAALMLPAASSFAQSYPLEEGQLQTDGNGGDDDVTTGETLTLRGGGFDPGSDVVVTIESTPVRLAQTRADERGDIQVEVEIPADFPPGDHTLKATGQAPGGGVLVLAQPVVVTGSSDGSGADSSAADGAATNQTNRELARTGTDAGRLIAIVGLLVVAGAVLLIATRRPRAQH